MILQPSFIPWRGYFDLIRRCDLFIFYDDVQYDRHGWRNRNRLKTPGGVRWLTIPVRSHNHLADQRTIREIAIDTIGSAITHPNARTRAPAIIAATEPAASAIT